MTTTGNTENNSRGQSVGRIAVICFLPDMGHVLPLLRLVHFITIHQAAKVTCFLAPRFEKIALEFGFDFHELASLERTANQNVFGELSRKSTFYNSFSGFAVLADSYWAPIERGISCELGSVAAKLSADRPEVVIADDHAFSHYYKTLADAYGAQLVLHRSNGSLQPYQRPFVYAYGLNDWPGWLQDMIETAGRANRKIARNWRMLSSPRLVRNAEEARMSLKRAVDNLFGRASTTLPCVPVRIACGTCVFEDRESSAITVQNPLRETLREIFLPPLVVPNTQPLSVELTSWLSQQSRPIVYISFGTLLRPGVNILRSLARGLKKAGVAALWALPATQRACLNAEHLPPGQFLFADFMPQTAVLFSGRVSCVVTHAGANSIHESLTAGIPMLCIPIIYDQHYNASVAVRLGSAVRLSSRKISSYNVRTSIEELLHNPRYAKSARDLAIEINRLRDELAHSREWADKIVQPDLLA